MNHITHLQNQIDRLKAQQERNMRDTWEALEALRKEQQQIAQQVTRAKP